MTYYFKNHLEVLFFSSITKSVYKNERTSFLIVNKELNGGTWYLHLKDKLLRQSIQGMILDIYSDQCDCPVKNRCKEYLNIRIYDN